MEREAGREAGREARREAGREGACRKAPMTRPNQVKTVTTSGLRISSVKEMSGLGYGLFFFPWLEICVGFEVWGNCRLKKHLCVTVNPDL